MYFYHRKLSAPAHDELPTLEPGARCRISARFMAPGHETPRARRGGAPRAGGPACYLSESGWVDMLTRPVALERAAVAMGASG